MKLSAYINTTKNLFKKQREMVANHGHCISWNLVDTLNYSSTDDYDNSVKQQLQTWVKDKQIEEDLNINDAIALLKQD